MIYPQNWTFFCNFQVKVRLNFELVCKTHFGCSLFNLVKIRSLIHSDKFDVATYRKLGCWWNFYKVAAYQALYMNYMYIYVFVYHIIFWNIFSRNVYLPILTTGHDFLHSCLHLFGLHLSLLTMAIRVSLSVGAVDLSFLDLDDICKVMILYIFHVLKIIPLKKI